MKNCMKLNNQGFGGVQKIQNSGLIRKTLILGTTKYYNKVQFDIRRSCLFEHLISSFHRTQNYIYLQTAVRERIGIVGWWRWCPLCCSRFQLCSLLIWPFWSKDTHTMRMIAYIQGFFPITPYFLSEAHFRSILRVLGCRPKWLNPMAGDTSVFPHLDNDDATPGRTQQCDDSAIQCLRLQCWRLQCWRPKCWRLQCWWPKCWRLQCWWPKCWRLRCDDNRRFFSSIRLQM